MAPGPAPTPDLGLARFARKLISIAGKAPLKLELARGIVIGVCAPCVDSGAHHLKAW